MLTSDNFDNIYYLSEYFKVELDLNALIREKYLNY